MKHRFLFLTIILSATGFGQLTAQNSGQTVYNLLNLASNARFAALGGSSPAAYDLNPSAAFYNPALVNPAMDRQIGLNYTNYLTDINYGYLAYSQDFKRFGSWAAGIQYLNYGTFIEANEYGDQLGSFSAAEYTFTLSASFAIDSIFRVGASVRPIYSVLERYQSFGFSTDASILYLSHNKRTTASLIMRNLGMQLSTYASPIREPLPFELMAAFSHKIQYAPFRLHFAARNLQVYQLRTDEDYNTNNPSGTSGTMNAFKTTAVTLTDHLVAGVEFVPGDLITLRLSYNFLRRFELRPDLMNSSAGLSFGAGLNFGWLHLDYALVNYHFTARAHLLSLGIDLRQLGKK